MVDKTPYVFVAELCRGKVAVVHVAREDDDGGRRLALLPGADGLDQTGKLGERLVERAPVVKVLRAPYLFSPHPAARLPHALEQTASFQACR